MSMLHGLLDEKYFLRDTVGPGMSSLINVTITLYGLIKWHL